MMNTEMNYKQKYRLEKRRNKHILNLFRYTQRLYQERNNRVDQKMIEFENNNKETNIRLTKIEEKLAEQKDFQIKLYEILEKLENKEKGFMEELEEKSAQIIALIQKQCQSEAELAPKESPRDQQDE